MTAKLPSTADSKSRLPQSPASIMCMFVLAMVSVFVGLLSKVGEPRVQYLTLVFVVALAGFSTLALFAILWFRPSSFRTVEKPELPRQDAHEALDQLYQRVALVPPSQPNRRIGTQPEVQKTAIK